MPPKPPDKGTSKRTKPTGKGTAVRQRQPAAPAKRNPMIFVGIGGGVLVLAIIIGVVVMSGDKETPPEPAKKDKDKAGDAVKPPKEPDKATQEKWTAWKAKHDDAKSDKKALLADADNLAPTFVGTPWSKEFEDLRAKLRTIVNPPAPIVEYDVFVAELEKKMKWKDLWDGKWGEAVIAIKERCKSQPQDEKKLGLIIQEIDQAMLRALPEFQREARNQKNQGKDAVAWLTSRRIQFAGTNAEMQFDALIEAMKK